ncbi:MAG: OmpA family protein [Devosia sp.]|nr:OmpA family protein [Devosia sp.]
MSGNTLKILVSALMFGMPACGAAAARSPMVPAGMGDPGTTFIPSPTGRAGWTVAADAVAPVLQVAQATPAPASPYTWTATKAADGAISLSGHVPTQEVRGSMTDGIAKLGSDNTTLASGEPDGFVDDAVAALSVLGDLDAGTVAFDGAAWSVTGVVDSADKAKTAEATFAASPLKTLGAGYNVSGPAGGPASGAPAPAAPATTPAATAPGTNAPAVPAATAAPGAPTATPAPAAPEYAWSAEKAGDGTITFSGSVANDKLKGFLVTHVSGKAVDNSVVAAGAPTGFVGGALYGLNALMGLESGKLSLSQGKWSLSGVAKDEAAGEQAKGALGVIDTKDWAIDITAAPVAAAAPAAPVATAPATAAPAASAPAVVVAPTPAASAVATAPATTPAAPAYVFSASKAANGTIALSGDVPTEGARGYFGDIAGSASTDGLVVVPNPPTDFITNALGGLDALGRLGQGELKLEGGKWSLSGKAPTPEGRDAVVAGLGKLPAAKDFVAADIVGPTPLELCTTKLAEVTAKGNNAINFEGRGTKFVKGADAALDAVAAALALCPDQRVDVEGNTDSDGGANTNMALSVARAEAVVDALIKRGLKQERLYAVGYGETLPLVPNTTKANKAKNRRIAFKIIN